MVVLVKNLPKFLYYEIRIRIDIRIIIILYIIKSSNSCVLVISFTVVVELKPFLFMV